LKTGRRDAIRPGFVKRAGLMVHSRPFSGLPLHKDESIS
jgi:hypothetical protein